jgi:SAM-dependent methyltransferase
MGATSRADAHALRLLDRLAIPDGARVLDLEGGRRELALEPDVLGPDTRSPLRASVDVVVCRFGVTFVENPVATLRNVRRLLARGGRLGLSVWRRREDNPLIHDVERRLRELRASRSPAWSAPTPGPFSLASADLLTDVFRTAGFGEVTLERHDAELCLGAGVGDAAEIAITLAAGSAPLGGVEDQRAVQEVLARYLTSEGVCAPSSAWMVTASVSA